MSRTMFQRILVPLDGSPFAEGAIGPAITMAEKAGGLIGLIAVQCRPEDEGRAMYTTDDAERYLEDMLLRYRAVTPIPIEIVVRHGEAAEEIVAEAAAHYDLIVMTSHGRGGLARAWFGSVADECVRTSRTPVLVVRPLESAPASLRLEVARIVVPLDGSELAESVLAPAAYLAELLDAPITLVRGVVIPTTTSLGYFPTTDSFPADPQELAIDAGAYLERVVRTRLERVRPRPHIRVTMGPNAAAAICDLAGPDVLVVMATHGRSGVERALLGSVADKVIRAAEGAVLVARPA